MTDLTNITKPATMTTREIAELVDKRHDNVMRDTKAMFDALEINPLSFEGIYRDERNREQSCYLLPRDLTMTLVTGYSIPLRKKVIDRLDELEGGLRQWRTPVDFSNPAILLGVVDHLRTTVSAQAQQIAAMAPAVEALEQIAEAHGSMCRTEAAKHLGISPHMLCKWMRTNAWTYRRAGTKDDLAYQSKINAGYLEHKVTTGPRPDGTEWIGTQVRVTPRGLTVLAKAFPKAAEPAVATALRNHLAKVA